MIRYGVHGSALPGLSTSAVFNAIAGTHSECTPGELLGRTTPSVCARGKKLSGPGHGRCRAPRRACPRVRPRSTCSISRHRRADLCMLLRTETVRQSSRGRQLLDVLLRRLRGSRRAAACHSENDRPRACRHLDQFARRERPRAPRAIPPASAGRAGSVRHSPG